MIRFGARPLASRSSRFLSTASIPDSFLNVQETQCDSLDNGFRVASQGTTGEIATVGLWVNAGSRFENSKNNGVSHFLEHMAFKGTANRSRVQLEMEIENMGGQLNAYTSREQTVYYASVFKDDVPKAVDVLSDIVQNAVYDEDAINRERDVILREMEEVEGDDYEVLFDKLHETAFQNGPLGQTILGPVENIRSLSKSDLQDYVAKFYTAPRMVLAGAGAIDHKQLVDLGKEHFSGLSAGDAQVDFPKPNFIGSDIRLRDDSKPVAQVAYAFECGSASSEQAIPLMVMQTMLGNWERTSTVGANMTSPLCRTIAENNHAHSVNAFTSLYQDVGLFGVHVTAEAEKLNEVSWTVLESMVGMCHKVTDEEVARAGKQLKASMLGSLNDSASICEDVGRQMLTYGRRMTPAEVALRIDAVDASVVKAVANEIINDQDIAVASVGPVHELPDYNWMRRRTYWLRT